MRQFASSGFRIWNLGREAKLVYTGFGLFALAALFVSILFYEDLVGGERSVRGYYGRTAAASTSEGAPPAGGPQIELPPGEPPPAMTVQVTYRKLLEVTHFHLFTVPVFVLIIAHLFMLTGLSTAHKVTFIATGWLSSALHLSAPWLIHYGSESLSFLYPVSGALMAISLTWMTAYPIMVMWLPRRAA